MLKRAAPFAVLLIMAAATSAAGAQSPLTKRRPTSASAAGSAVQPDGRPLVVEEEDARRTRERLSEMLRQYPPSLSEVLRIDPSLLTNEGYLAPYPALAAFLAQHPEVAHNPGYFIGEVRFREDTPTLQKMRLLQDVMIGLVMFLVFITLISVIAWLLKSLIDYRRWLRLTNVQTDVHTKLLDRFTSNEDLLAYIQTPVGRRFLESAPISLEPGPRTIGAPLGRILWSVQAGLVGALAGAGLLYVSARLAATPGDAADVAPIVFAIGMLVLAVGAGFVLSAVVAYALSQRLGLFERPVITPHA